MPYLPEIYTEPEVRAWMAAVVLKTNHVIAARDADGGVAGFAAVRDDHLDHLYVAPAAQRRGVGAALLAAAQQASPAGLSLHVFQRNAPARRFYERHGFRLTKLRDGSDNEENEPDAVYRWP